MYIMLPGIHILTPAGFFPLVFFRKGLYVFVLTAHGSLFEVPFHLKNMFSFLFLLFSFTVQNKRMYLQNVECMCCLNSHLLKWTIFSVLIGFE